VIERFELSPTPLSKPTIQLIPSEGTLYLNVDALYWGTRVDDTALTENAAIIKKAEAYLSKHFV
jgi:hypothetical protein